MQVTIVVLLGLVFGRLEGTAEPLPSCRIHKVAEQIVVGVVEARRVLTEQRVNHMEVGALDNFSHVLLPLQLSIQLLHIIEAEVVKLLECRVLNDVVEGAQ